MVNVILQSEKKLKNYFLNPEIKFEEKKESLKNLLGKKISEYAYNFVFELIEKEELEILSLVIERLKILVYKENGTIEAEVISATDLSNSVKNSILKKIEMKVQKKVKLNTEVDANLLGGIKVKIGDEMVDLSVRGKLDSLRQEIVG